MHVFIHVQWKWDKFIHHHLHNYSSHHSAHLIFSCTFIVHHISIDIIKNGCVFISTKHFHRSSHLTFISMRQSAYISLMHLQPHTTCVILLHSLITSTASHGHGAATSRAKNEFVSIDMHTCVRVCIITATACVLRCHAWSTLYRYARSHCYTWIELCHRMSLMVQSSFIHLHLPFPLESARVRITITVHENRVAATHRGSEHSHSDSDDIHNLI
jgi:hypothetical protein